MALMADSLASLGGFCILLYGILWSGILHKSLRAFQSHPVCFIHTSWQFLLHEEVYAVAGRAGQASWAPIDKSNSPLAGPCWFPSRTGAWMIRRLEMFNDTDTLQMQQRGSSESPSIPKIEQWSSNGANALYVFLAHVLSLGLIWAGLKQKA